MTNLEGSRRLHQERVPKPQHSVPVERGADWDEAAFARTQRNSQRHEQVSSSSEFDEVYDGLVRRYTETGEPVEVNFRQLLPLASGVERATHLMHSYPAKLLVNIPLFFLNCSQLGSSGTKVLDPFCGTGTVLVEALLAGRSTAGTDANPLARLIARAKVTPLDDVEIRRAFRLVSRTFKAVRPEPFSPVVDVHRWFSPRVVQDLGRLLAAIRTVCDGDMGQFMEVCFSSIVRKVSFADPRLSVPVRLKPGRERQPTPVSENIMDLFSRAVAVNAARLQSLRQVGVELLNIPVGEDARDLGLNANGADVDLVITSPPYVGAQKYIRASSLSIGWLGLAPEAKLRSLERLNIGREHFSKSEYAGPPLVPVPSAEATLSRIWNINPLRAHIAGTYLCEMRDALEVICARLRNGGHFVLVIGNNSICGATFPTSDYIGQMIVCLGLSLELELIDDIRSRGLMTKRNRTAGLISREHILVFRK